MIKHLKKFREFLKQDTPLSWIVNVILAFLIVRYIIYPILGLMLATSHPLVAVVSGSMEHRTSPVCIQYDNINQKCLKYEHTICGVNFKDSKKFNFNEYWEICGKYYEVNYQITKEQFKEFPHKNGFKKGDIMLLKGSEKYNIGDVIIYPNKKYKYPIIHRVVKKYNNVYKTKGDHNLAGDSIEVTKPIGKAILRIPKLGYIKIIFTDYIVKPVFGG